jgi:hypothetical protein
VRNSPLLALFALEQKQDAPGALQRLIAKAIDALEPQEDSPVGSTTWRTYQVLHGRYIDQFSQEEVARDLFLSARQLRRLEQVAVEILADHLWASHNLEERARLLFEGGVELKEALDAQMIVSGPSGREEEFSWLERTITSQVVDCLEFVQSAVQTVQPLLASLQSEVLLINAPNLPQLSVHLTTARQALLHLITLAAHQAGGGQIQIQVEPDPSQMYVRLNIRVLSTGALSLPAPVPGEEFDVAQKLVQLSKGNLDWAPGSLRTDKLSNNLFNASMTLPTAERVPVLIIDDNIDTLHLIERYLSGTPYHYNGISHPSEAIEAAERILPKVILMDVMLPDMDGIY